MDKFTQIFGIVEDQKTIGNEEFLLIQGKWHPISNLRQLAKSLGVSADILDFSVNQEFPPFSNTPNQLNEPTPQPTQNRSLDKILAESQRKPTPDLERCLIQNQGSERLFSSQQNLQHYQKSSKRDEFRQTSEQAQKHIPISKRGMAIASATVSLSINISSQFSQSKERKIRPEKGLIGKTDSPIKQHEDVEPKVQPEEEFRHWSESYFDRVDLMDMSRLDEEIERLLQIRKTEPLLLPFLVQENTSNFSYFEFQICSKPRKRKCRSIKAYLEKKRQYKLLKLEQSGREGDGSREHREEISKRSASGSEKGRSRSSSRHASGVQPSPIYQSSSSESEEDPDKSNSSATKKHSQEKHSNRTIQMQAQVYPSRFESSKQIQQNQLRDRKQTFADAIITHSFETIHNMDTLHIAEIIQIGTSGDLIVAKVLTQNSQIKFIEYETLKELRSDLIVKFYKKAIFE